MSLLQAFVDTTVLVGRFDVPDVLLGRKGVTKELGNLSDMVFKQLMASIEAPVNAIFCRFFGHVDG